MANYTVGDYLGQDSTEYLVYQILQKIQAVRELISGITHVDVSTSATIPTDPPAHPEDTLYFVRVGPGTLELQSETTTRLFGSFYANGATQT